MQRVGPEYNGRALLSLVPGPPQQCSAAGYQYGTNKTLHCLGFDTDVHAISGIKTKGHQWQGREYRYYQARVEQQTGDQKSHDTDSAFNQEKPGKTGTQFTLVTQTLIEVNYIGWPAGAE